MKVFLKLGKATKTIAVVFLNFYFFIFVLEFPFDGPEAKNGMITTSLLAAMVLVFTATNRKKGVWRSSAEGE